MGRLTIVLTALVVAAASAQAPVTSQSATSSPAFDVVSIKVNTSGTGSTSVRMAGGRLTMVNSTAMNIVQNGWGQQTFHIVGAPGWMNSERYDVSATSPIADPTRDQYRSMMRALLSDRFKLAAHTEVRQMPAYALMRARADSALGPRLRKWDVDCDALSAARREKRDLEGPPQVSTLGAPVCGMRAGPTNYAAAGVTMEAFAGSLASDLGRTVTDRTGLDGVYELVLQWTPEQPPGAAASNEFGSVFTALREQLGLKLEPERTAVEVLVIDSIERPSEN